MAAKAHNARKQIGIVAKKQWSMQCRKLSCWRTDGKVQERQKKKDQNRANSTDRLLCAALRSEIENIVAILFINK